MDDRNSKVLSVEELKSVSGGQYDVTAPFIDSVLVCEQETKLYYERAYMTVQRVLPPGRYHVKVHTDFLVMIFDECFGDIFLNLIILDGERYCVNNAFLTPNITIQNRDSY